MTGPLKRFQGFWEPRRRFREKTQPVEKEVGKRTGEAGESYDRGQLEYQMRVKQELCSSCKQENGGPWLVTTTSIVKSSVGCRNLKCLSRVAIVAVPTKSQVDSYSAWTHRFSKTHIDAHASYDRR